MSEHHLHRPHRGARPGRDEEPKLAKDYTVGWVCALPVEKAAAEQILDEHHPKLLQDPSDTNIYTLGRIGDHNVVIAHLPAGRTGTNSAATVAIQMKSTFSSIRFGLMVGIGGGVPSDTVDIRLGDVVVSQPRNGYGGVVQHDFGKSRPQEFESNGFLNAPPTVLLNAIAQLQTNYNQGKRHLSTYLAPLTNLPLFARPPEADLLFEASYDHQRESDSNCEFCDDSRLVRRNPRDDDQTLVYYGTIASGNQLMRHGAMRDNISSAFNGILCFEMEAAGLMNSFPCLVIRGICDYADSHKNKNWQPFAAATAAAYAKELLSVLPRTEVDKIPIIGDTMTIRRLRSTIDEVDLKSIAPILSVLNQTQYESSIELSRQEISRLSWIFNDADFKCWKDTSRSQALWLQAPLDRYRQKAASVILHDERLRASENNQRVLYFFFQDIKHDYFDMKVLVDTLLHQIICDLSPEEGLLVIKHFLNFLLEDLIRTEEVPNPRLKPFKRQENSKDEIKKLMRQSADARLGALKAVIALDQSRRLSLILDRVDLLGSQKLFSFVESLLQATSIVRALLISGPDIDCPFAGFNRIIHDKERKECMTSLQFENAHYDKISDAHIGTFQWLRTHPQYIEWSTSPKSRLLLLEGKPGSGKSTLMKYINEKIFKPELTSSSAVVAKFFYSYRGGELERNHSNMLKCLLHDILRQDEAFFYHKFQAEYRAHIAEGQTDWRYESLQRIFKSLTDYPFLTRLYIIIDAVDESESDDRRVILDILMNICRDVRQGVLKVFMASRPLGGLESRSKKIDNFIRLQAETKLDIRKMTSSLLNQVNFTDLLDDALKYIEKHAEGVFLWVKLVGDELLASVDAGHSEEVIFEVLQNLPKELEGFYAHMFKGMNQNKAKLMDGFDMLQLVLWARRPLTVDELLHGLAIAYKMDNTVPSDESFRRRIPFKEHIIHYGGNFLEIKPNQDNALIFKPSIPDGHSSGNGTVQVMHQTVREFFLKPHQCVTRSNFQIDNVAAHNWIATACMRYLLLCFSFPDLTDGLNEVESWTTEQFKSYAEYLNHRPFAKYALSYLKHHLDSCGLRVSTTEFAIKFKDLSPGTACYQLLRNWLNEEENITSQPSDRTTADRIKHHLFHAASSLGLSVAVGVLLAAGADMNSQDEDGKTPLAQAAKFGHLSVMQLLIALPNINTDPKDNNGLSVLHYAAEWGQEAVVRFLNQQGSVRIDCLDNFQRSPISGAAARGHDQVVKLLLSWDAIADAKDRIGQTPLSRAAAGGHSSVVELLANRSDVDADAKDKYGRTPLSWAAAGGHSPVVELLAKRSDVDADAKDRNGRTPLSWAAAEGHSSVVELLAKRREVDADAKNEDGRTPLSWAAEGGNDDVVKILAQRNGVQADAKDNRGRTALSRAAEQGHEAVVKIFLARNSIQVPVGNSRGVFGLSRGVGQGVKSIMRLVLGNNDIEVDAPDKTGRSPMAWAAYRGYDNVVRLLLRRQDVDCNLRDRFGQTPLLLAAKEGHEHVVKLLLEFEDVDANSEDNSGRTPLSFAAERRHSNVVALLLNHPKVIADGDDNVLRELLLVSSYTR